MKKYKKFRHFIIGILFGITLGMGYEEYNGASNWHNIDIDTKNTKICFTPPKGCADLIAKEVAGAKDSIYMHAYGLTSKPIILELKEAAKRGVKVKALLDSSNFSESKTIYKEMKKSGIEVVLDKVPGIAHNKIIIIDGEKVITGSFNFTKSADTRNAENVLLIKDIGLASIYFENWRNRRSKGQRY